MRIEVKIAKGDGAHLGNVGILGNVDNLTPARASTMRFIAGRSNEVGL
jgi:hypothetical protein